MIKRTTAITLLMMITLLSLNAQERKQEPSLKREVTLYNPYKPSLNIVRKRSFLPDMKDTMQIRPVFNYEVNSEPFMPAYTISPIKAAALMPDPLPKLYKSYINAGLGTHLSPLGEISITNERSKKGAIGLYARHFSTNGKVKLENDDKVFAGYMDNDASLFGKRFIKKSILEGSVDFTQKIRYAYGNDPEITGYTSEKDSVRMKYNNIGAKASFSSATLDSSDLFYDVDLAYDYFHHLPDMFQQKFVLDGDFAKSVKGFYIGSGINYELYLPADSIDTGSAYIFALSPFISKAKEQWNFKLGFEALMDREGDFNLYPDVEFGFNVVPSYLSFFTTLSGYLERNDPLKLVSENPFIASKKFFGSAPDAMLFRLPDTDHELIVSAGFKGNTGIDGNYLISASYSFIENMLFYSNIVFPDSVVPRAVGNYFMPITGLGELLNIHGEITGRISDKMTFSGMANFYNYSFGITPWNKPSWDGKFGLDYNLRDKIVAGVELAALGKRTQIINGDYSSRNAGYLSREISMPSHFNLNLTAEYRYSNILSFWTKFNNISFRDYYEWAYYPSQRFFFMVGFTYSL
ncbi:MAG: hypothetical protein A2X03_15580 [Bacteroidetes bacterium GWA2_40_15]|nr:MAG: hypothetical protein A2X03_15580 [Bacteroidetes bacterium GWA2_40_15]OFX86865.1 MAG: hypothetical protein A2X06_14545 [Bacteroidetes bacterium GWC2_40_22]HBH84782.1 hypothetical protein [Bacteroidales bacterium]